jgi:hypothetical protein
MLLLKEQQAAKRTAGSERSILHQGRVAHISLVFREMWDSADLDR